MGSPIVKHGGRSAVLALVLLAVPAAGASQRLVVIVEDDASGQRLQGATVCVGTTANRAQLGTDETNLNGRAAFDGLPAGTWKVTVNLEGYRGEGRDVTLGGGDVTRTIRLAAGTDGPSCGAAERADATLPSARVQC